MNEQLLVEYAPIIILVLAFIWKHKLFVTPSQLLQTKEDILKSVKEEYATKELVQFIRNDISEIKREFADLNIFIRSHLEKNKE